jgi:hypothetical protein
LALLITLVMIATLVSQASAAASSSLTPQTLHWQLLGPADGERVNDIDVDPNNPRRLYATTQSGIFRSTDGGSSWDLILAGFFRDLVIDPQNSDNVYTGPGGVYKSTDGGDSWTPYYEGMTCTNLATLTISATDPNILFTGSF